jgi:decaprenyl-phosphate phosphoribosyltransferase
MFRDLLRLSRPHHWVKNVFVLMPLPFAAAAGAQIEPAPFLLGLLGFCLASSAVYAFNDAQDIERDRLHPSKRKRPVAAGRVSPALARAWALGLATASFALCAASGHVDAVLVTAAYLVLNAFYTFGGKHVPVVDVFLLASYYMLRVTLGCVLVDVVPSNWLLLCTGALALFLALAKRRADIEMGLHTDHRPALEGYTLAYLDQGMAVMAATTLIAYALYCREATVMLPGREFATLPLVVFVVLEYLRLVHVEGEGGSPVDLLWRSPLLVACGAGWVVAALWSVGLP